MNETESSLNEMNESVNLKILLSIVVKNLFTSQQPARRSIPLCIYLHFGLIK